MSKNKKIIWTLIKYFKFQTDTSQRRGKIIMRGNTPNGFVEKIFELGFNEYVYTMQREHKGDISYSVQIGQYPDEKAENEINKSIAQASEVLLPLLDLLKRKKDGKHLEEISFQQHFRETNDDNCDEKPTLKQFSNYCTSLISKGVGVNNKWIKDLYVYFNETTNWKIGGKPMKDWRVAAKTAFLKHKLK
jgi:hypothetical protein